MLRRASLVAISAAQSGQALVLLLGIVAAAMLGTLVLAALGQALGGRSRHQRAADLAAISAAAAMRRDHPRLFEPARLDGGAPNPRHLSTAAYVTRARAAGVRAASRNGVRISRRDVTFEANSFAPTRVTVRVRGETRVRIERRRRPVAVRARATAELAPGDDGIGQPGFGIGGGYDGPLAYRQGKPSPYLFSVL